MERRTATTPDRTQATRVFDRSICALASAALPSIMRHERMQCIMSVMHVPCTCSAQALQLGTKRRQKATCKRFLLRQRPKQPRRSMSSSAAGAGSSQQRGSWRPARSVQRTEHFAMACAAEARDGPAAAPTACAVIDAPTRELLVGLQPPASVTNVGDVSVHGSRSPQDRIWRQQAAGGSSMRKLCCAGGARYRCSGSSVSLLPTPSKSASD